MSFVMNVAILGAGAIARSMCKTVRGMKDAGRPVELYAVASRSQEKADAFAKEEGVLKAYGSYEAMLADPDVHLVYIATPHSHHAEQMKMCIRAGKNVLCEKAFTPNLHQAEEVLALAKEKGVYVAEALWPRYMPSRWIINDLLEQGVIGEPRMLYSNLCYAIENKERIMDPNLAGGALLDLGVYVLNFASMAFGDKVERMESTVAKFDTGADHSETMTLYYQDGRIAMLQATALARTDRNCVICGDKGAIRVDNVNNPQVITVYDNIQANKVRQVINVPEQITGYEYEVEACMRALENGDMECPEMPHSQIIHMMKVMDAFREQWGVVYPFD